ncbi:aminotransferase class IV [Brevundimonas sp. SORGH_AS_0993]|uniref:aminotransferase class IV n=1 Tax=Brevundimonas sp. SORGH_AS_0993 TaxID=3041794 RepID=UPI00278B6FEC|nr:aminotransferase class IV [Brevundimonas sp. SORGH_AS_0993]MDQ1153994.1 branched-subunit amino acid aminotransferase/4-amino-4-deoxychorismate lyase [Brevundimonas sp. SORGH_AS_0993]
MDILIDGRPATTEDLTHQALVNYGAYTSFRVERGAVRGLDLHLTRLEQAAVELFGESPGEAELRRLMALAVEGRDACWLRVSLFSPEIGHRNPSFVGRPRVMTVVSPPPPPLATSMRVTTVPHVRETPHLKHVATFGQTRARRAARAAGFDDVLFIDGQGCVSEGATWNIGFIQGDRIVWPQALMLAGVTQSLIQRGLEAAGLPSEIRPVPLDEAATLDGAFLCNAATPICPITAIGEIAIATDPAVLSRLERAWSSQPPQPVAV